MVRGPDDEGDVKLAARVKFRGLLERTSVMSPRLDIALRAVTRPRADDLRGLRFTALGFKVAVMGPRPIAVAYAVDEDGVEHWLGARAATSGVERAYQELLSDLLRRGLRSTRSPLVDAGGYPRVARRVELGLGSVVHTEGAWGGGRGGARGALAW